MRIDCCFCGTRDANEFVYHGAAAPARPDAASSDTSSLFHDYVYLRKNAAGPHEEYWYHAYGCRAWLRITRDTSTHTVLAVHPRTEGC